MIRHPYRSGFAVLAVLPLAFSSHLTPGWAGSGPDCSFEDLEDAEVARLRGQELGSLGSQRGDAVLVHDATTLPVLRLRLR